MSWGLVLQISTLMILGTLCAGVLIQLWANATYEKDDQQ
jgi:hypothetical protein